MPFLNQQKGENDRRKYFMINLQERMLPTLAGVEPTTSWSLVRCAGGRGFDPHRGWQHSFVTRYLLYLISSYSVIFFLSQKYNDDDLVFNVPFNTIKIIWKPWKGDNERLCAIKCRRHKLNSASNRGQLFKANDVVS